MAITFLHHFPQINLVNFVISNNTFNDFFIKIIRSSHFSVMIIIKYYKLHIISMCALVYKIQIPFLGQVDARGTQKKTSTSKSHMLTIILTRNINIIMEIN